MLLIKCNCGCMFTIMDNAISQGSDFICQNCHSRIALNKFMINEHPEHIEDNAKIIRIPDNTKITFSFDV